MFKKSKRLRRSDQIKLTIEKGLGLKTPFFALKYLNIDSLPKFTVVVSKKISKKATDRNRIKRVLREAIKATYLNYDLRWYFVFFPFISSMDLKSSDLIERVDYVFKKITNT